LAQEFTTETTLKPTIRTNVRTRGIIARLSIVDKRLFHILDADTISDALRRAIRQMTDMTLTSDTPIVETVLTTEDVVLIVLIVLSIDDSKLDTLP
jgi:hypothetical protein